MLRKIAKSNWPWCIFFFMMTGMMSIYSNPIEVDNKRGVVGIEGIDYPMVGFGTSPLHDQVCEEAVKQAAEIGYRIIDTATYYQNFRAIAKALEGQDRHRFYIISKVWHSMLSPTDLRQDLDRTLEQLQTDYLDAYLVHWPNSEIPIEKTLTAMEELRQAKKIRHIGLSNVTVSHLKRALELDIPIHWVQIEMNPYFYDPELLKFCEEHSITIQAWSPLERGRVYEDAILAKMSQKYGKTSFQVAIRWICQHGCVPLVNSRNEKHMRENMEIGDFQLSMEEMEEIDQRAKVGQRRRYGKEKLGFTDEFDFSYEECWPKRLGTD